MLKGHTIIEDVAIAPASIHSYGRLIMLRYTRCNIVIFMAASAWLMSFSSCIVCGFDSYWKVRYTNQIRTQYRNWRTGSTTELQPSKSLFYIGYTSIWWQHYCWLTVETLCAVYEYILTPERNHKDTCKTEGGLLFRGPSVCNKQVKQKGLTQKSLDVCELRFSGFRPSMTVLMPLLKPFVNGCDESGYVDVADDSASPTLRTAISQIILSPVKLCLLLIMV